MRLPEKDPFLRASLCTVEDQYIEGVLYRRALSVLSFIEEGRPRKVRQKIKEVVAQLLGRGIRPLDGRDLIEPWYALYFDLDHACLRQLRAAVEELRDDLALPAQRAREAFRRARAPKKISPQEQARRYSAWIKNRKVDEAEKARRRCVLKGRRIAYHQRQDAERAKLSWGVPTPKHLRRL